MAKKSPSETLVVIIGAGIGGLSVALCLHRAGFKVAVYERAPEVSEMGVGINLLPHASKILHSLGLGKSLDRIGVPTSKVSYYSHRGNLIYSEPRGRDAGYDAPQYSIHRGKLQLMLLEAVKAQIGADCVRTDHELVSFTQDADGVEVFFKSGVTNQGRGSVRGDLMIGVDGIKSTTRNILYPHEVPKFTGWMIYRGAVKTDAFLDGRTMAVVGKGDTLIVLYPIDNELASQGSTQSVINWGALRKVTSGPTDENWQKRGRKEDFAHFFSDWKFDWINLEKLIAETEPVMEYAMHDRDPVMKWSFGRVTLCGDAAHPLLPFGSQGAGQAILDAEALEKALSNAAKSHGDYVQALVDYEKSRVEIARQVVETNRQMGPTRILKVYEENPSVSVEEIKKISQGYAVAAGVRAKL